MSKDMNLLEKQTQFVLTALMEIPLQYKATLKLGLPGARTGSAPNVIPLPPPSLQGATSEFVSPSAPEYRRNEMYGNKTCSNCGFNLTLCPICRNLIKTKIRLF
uniref:Uncharacterized protein n=1 Tax=Tanacetum cinerariifolium TaxID=118510 RepID=A0A699L2P1_TANCI|nr:hypothetical protein [Tanacetum cinerariifolium]